MPTKEQMQTTTEHIKDVIGKNYIEGDGDECSCRFHPEGGGTVGRALFVGATDGRAESFKDLPWDAQVELLMTCVDWDSFSHALRWCIIQRVQDRERPDMWMDGIEVTKSHDDGREQFKAILAGDSCKKYEQFLTTSTERALDRMQGKEGIER